MRWLLLKDLQILRRSPLLVGLLIAYPIAIALMIGFALSSPPGKPKVAFLSEVPRGQGVVKLGGQRVDASRYASELFKSVDPIRVHSRAEALAKVRSGEALAALIIPRDIVSQLDQLLSTGIGTPTIELALNVKDPVEREYVDSVIKARLVDVQSALSSQVLKTAVTDLNTVLAGGSIEFAGESQSLVGLRNTRTILAAIARDRGTPPTVRAQLAPVIDFANLAITGLGFASPVLGSIGHPLTIQRTDLAGRTTPTDAYAVAVSVVVSLMFLTLLLASGMLALEREEHVFARLVRGLVTRGQLLAEKIGLAAACAAAVTLLMLAGVSLFVSVQWSRFPLWVLALVAGGCAFAALGVAIGSLAREVRAASLLAFLLSLPIAFLALVPAGAVSGGLHSVLAGLSALFPFKPTLDLMTHALSASGGGVGLPLVHLLVLTLAFGALARVALRRF